MSEDKAKLFKTWCSRLEREKSAHKPFRELAKRAMKAFERPPSQTEDGKVMGYPVWWSNVTITQAAVFNRQPKPDVRRRLKDSGADKQLSVAIERCLDYQLDTTPFDEHSNRAVCEFLVTALGATRVYLKTDTEDQPVFDPIMGLPIMGEDGQPLMQKVITGQYTCLEYIPFDLFRWEPCKDWEDCGWVSFDRWMSAREIRQEYGEDMGEREGDYSDSPDSNKPGGQKYANLHLVHEIWDKRTRQVITLCSTSKKYGQPLKVEPDKLRLKGFFPCPRPMMLNLKSGELCPVSEYHWIETLCDEIDRLSDRVRNICKGLKDVAIFDSAFGAELANIMNESDGARIPVAGLMQKLNGGNIPFLTDDLKQKVEVMVQLVNERERAKADLYEITGIADIVRGATRASETATAQQLKSQWANVRLSGKMREISTHFRGVFRVMAELISEHFEPQQIQAQSGVQITPEMQQLMKSDVGRTYAIDIESDSTIAQDEEGEKAARLEFVQGFTQFVQTVIPMQQQGMIPADLANSVLRFYVGSFKHGRVIEEQIDALPGTQQQLQTMQGELQTAQQQGQQANAQLQAVQAEMAKVQQQAAADKADLEQQIAQLAARSQMKPESPTKQIRDMAEARKAEAIASREEMETAAIGQQIAQDRMFGPM